MKAKNQTKSVLAALAYLIRKQGLTAAEVEKLIIKTIKDENTNICDAWATDGSGTTRGILFSLHCISAMSIATIATLGALAVIMTVRAVVVSQDTKKDKNNKNKNRWIH